MVSMRSLLAYFLVDKPRVRFFVLCCALVLFLAWKQRDRLSVLLRRYLVVPSIVLLVLLFNPVVAHLLVTRYEETRSLRFFWLVPVPLLMALVIVVLLDKFSGKKAKVLVAGVIPIVLLTFSNGFVQLRSTWMNTFTNWYKVPPVVINLDEWIVQDESELEKTAIFPTPLNLWVRQYRPEIELPYEWTKVNWQSEAAAQLYWEIEQAEKAVDLEKVDHWAMEGGYNYIVLDTLENYENNLENYEEIYRVDIDPSQDTNSYDREYILYRRVGEE